MRVAHPGGAIYAVDSAQGMTFYFQAPRKYLGNKTWALGGSLEFDVKYSGPDDMFTTPDVILVGGGMTLVVDAGPEPGTEWTHYRVPLDESGCWRIENPFTGELATQRQIYRVLKSLNVLQIRGEYGVGVDTGYLDNVRVLPQWASD